MTREECMRTRNHAEWLRNQEWWANWPMQTVKRRKGSWYELGVVLSSNPSKIFLTPHGWIIDIKVGDLECKEYPSIDAMLADGWVVD